MLQPHSKNSPPRHLPYLDTARGIAAMMVLFGHYVGWHYNDKLIVRYATYPFNATDAVSFFFVLSGMVLTYQYLVLGNNLDIRKYFINRFMRLFPAFFIAVLINALYNQRHHLNLEHLVNMFLLNKKEFWEEAILIRSHANYFVPGWTLVLELAISFFIPFLLIIARADRRWLWWLLASFFIVMPVVNMFVFHFTLGIVISCYYHELTSPDLKEKKWYRYRYLILLLAVVLFSIRRYEELNPFDDIANYYGNYFKITFYHCSAVASFIFIIWMMRNQRLQRVLEWRPLVFIGKVSYGLYLMHWLVVAFIFNNWNAILPLFPNTTSAFIIMMFLCFGITLLLATIVHYFIELPFIRIGKRFASKLKPSMIIEGTKA